MTKRGPLNCTHGMMLDHLFSVDCCNIHTSDYSIHILTNSMKRITNPLLKNREKWKGGFVLFNITKV